MGWRDQHLHYFKIKDKKNNDEEKEIGDMNMLEVYTPSIADWLINLKDYFDDTHRSVIYMYDFGDNWEHEIVFEKELEATPKVKYPKCIDGKRACPPEDVGGIGGYYDFLKAIKDKKHK